MIGHTGVFNRVRRGFTLVEVLVTTSLFSLVMSVLLVGVFSGTRAWDQADRHLERRAVIRAALEQFRQDVEMSQMASAEAGGLFADSAGRPIFQSITFETTPGSPWSGAMLQVEWSVMESPDGLNWTRESQPLIGDERMGSLERELMIEGLESLELELRQGDVWVAQADPEGPDPDLMRLTLEAEGGNDYQLVLSLRAGEASSAPAGGENHEEGEEADGGGSPEGGAGGEPAGAGGEDAP